jgi:hypothetical protein
MSKERTINPNKSRESELRSRRTKLGVHLIAGHEFNVRYLPGRGISFKRVGHPFQKTISLQDILELHLGQETLRFSPAGDELRRESHS